MRILHTADWHLGQRFFDRDRNQEHQAFLDFLYGLLVQEEIDLLLLAGDVFDTANPPTEAEKAYYDFLRRVADLEGCAVVVIGGNHDSAAHLDAPGRYLKGNAIHVVGAFPDDPRQAFLVFDECCVAAVPYLRDRDVRRAVEGESIGDMEARTRTGILRRYAHMGELAASACQGKPVIAMGHLTAVGGQVGDAERTIHIGNLGSIAAAQFPEIFAYVALGHLHRPQAVGGQERIRYSGSPIPLSFQESAWEKEVRLLELGDGRVEHRGIRVPVFRRLLRLTGSVEELKGQLSEIEIAADELTPWVELTLRERTTRAQNDELREAAAATGLAVLKIVVEAGRHSLGDAAGEEEDVEIADLRPTDVFAKRLEASAVECHPATLAQCFQTILTETQEGRER